ncbi:MAG: hypothetical protein Q8Q23_03880 [bacterium]|nr:hypothetical protein [bacterium]
MKNQDNNSAFDEKIDQLKKERKSQEEEIPNRYTDDMNFFEQGISLNVQFENGD